MISPKAIITWLRSNVNLSMRLSRIKTLAALTCAATRKSGMGVLALGRVMNGKALAKHRIKRVFRFLKNDSVEVSEVQRRILEASDSGKGELIVLIDWTDLPPYRTLILSVARRGRSIPFLSLTVPIDCTGAMSRAEQLAINFLAQLLPKDREVIIIGDRGFGNMTWVRRLNELGWGYVLRLTARMYACTDTTGGKLKHFGVGPGARAKRWGNATLTNHRPTMTQLVSVWRAESTEPWFLATNLSLSARRIVRLYAKRMWIELTIRDLKNRRWGLGLGEVRLSTTARMDRLFLVAMLAYFFLFAYGTAAERMGLADSLKANTESRRALSVATTGFLLYHQLKIPLAKAIKSLACKEHT